MTILFAIFLMHDCILFKYTVHISFFLQLSNSVIENNIQETRSSLASSVHVVRDITDNTYIYTLTSQEVDCVFQNLK